MLGRNAGEYFYWHSELHHIPDLTDVAASFTRETRTINFNDNSFHHMGLDDRFAARSRFLLVRPLSLSLFFACTLAWHVVGWVRIWIVKSNVVYSIESTRPDGRARFTSGSRAHTPFDWRAMMVLGCLWAMVWWSMRMVCTVLK